MNFFTSLLAPCQSIRSALHRALQQSFQEEFTDILYSNALLLPSNLIVQLRIPFTTELASRADCNMLKMIVVQKNHIFNSAINQTSLPDSIKTTLKENLNEYIINFHNDTARGTPHDKKPNFDIAEKYAEKLSSLWNNIQLFTSDGCIEKSNKDEPEFESSPSLAQSLLSFFSAEQITHVLLFGHGSSVDRLLNAKIRSEPSIAVMARSLSSHASRDHPDYTTVTAEYLARPLNFIEGKIRIYLMSCQTLSKGNKMLAALLHYYLANETEIYTPHFPKQLGSEGSYTLAPSIMLAKPNTSIPSMEIAGERYPLRHASSLTKWTRPLPSKRLLEKLVDIFKTDPEANPSPKAEDEWDEKIEKKRAKIKKNRQMRLNSTKKHSSKKTITPEQPRHTESPKTVSYFPDLSEIGRTCTATQPLQTPEAQKAKPAPQTPPRSRSRAGKKVEIPGTPSPASTEWTQEQAAIQAKLVGKVLKIC
jgi:hypothetical protein